MKKTIVLIAILVLAILLIGCGQKQYDYTGAATAGGQAPVVGGGCGVIEQSDYAETPSAAAETGF